MQPGFYVVRMPSRGMQSRLIVESRPFRIADNLPSGIDPRKYAEERANEWKTFIQGKHPKDDVFVIERKPEDTEESGS